MDSSLQELQNRPSASIWWRAAAVSAAAAAGWGEDNSFMGANVQGQNGALLGRGAMNNQFGQQGQNQNGGAGSARSSASSAAPSSPTSRRSSWPRPAGDAGVRVAELLASRQAITYVSSISV